MATMSNLPRCCSQCGAELPPAPVPIDTFRSAPVCPNCAEVMAFVYRNHYGYDPVCPFGKEELDQIRRRIEVNHEVWMQQGRPIDEKQRNKMSRVRTWAERVFKLGE